MIKQCNLISGLVVILFALSLAAHAQTRVGIQVGMNFSGVDIVDANGDKQHTEAIPRLQAGLSVDIPLAMGLYLQPGVMYAGKGFKQYGGWLAGPDKEFKAAASYVEIPVNLLYKKWIGIGNLLVGAGPYVGHGLGGRWEAEGHLVVGDIVLTESSGDVIFKNDVADGEFGSYLYGKPWDYGANVSVGYQFSPKLTLQLHGQFGIANLVPDANGERTEGSIRNRGYGISIGFGF